RGSRCRHGRRTSSRRSGVEVARATTREPEKGTRHMDEDIYIVDTRNADHRTPQHGTVVPGRVGTGVRTVVAQPARAYGPPSYAQPQPQIIYAGPPQGQFASNLFGRMTGGQLV